jgi:hypothetical protein
MSTEPLYDIWIRKNPRFEFRFEKSLFKTYTDYGTGASEYTAAKGKVFGAGYELYIYAFFIGLYSNQRMKLHNENKILGHPIQYWGNLESKKNRKAYPKLKEYIFIALIARTCELDLITLEKGDVTTRKVVDSLVNTMEEYANYGLHVIEDKSKDSPDYFYKKTGFLDMILDMIRPDSEMNNSEELEEL